MSTHDDLRQVALAEFAVAGYAGTSLQRIAEIAGLSKSSVLYHYASKEALLEAAIAPAIDHLEAIMTGLDGRTLFDAESRSVFVSQFVDILLEHRLEVHMFINQGPGLEDVPVIDRANELVDQLAAFFADAVSSTEDHLRFGIALGGAAYVLSSKHDHGEAFPVGELRAGLITIVSELLEPLADRPISSRTSATAN